MGGRCDLSGSAVLLSGAAEGLPGQERERKNRGCKWCGACSQQLHWQEDYRIKLYICLQGPLGCFLICLTLEGTGKVEASEVGLSCPELVTSSVSCSPEMKVALSLVAVFGCCIHTRQSCCSGLSGALHCDLPATSTPHTPTFSF